MLQNETDTWILFQSLCFSPIFSHRYVFIWITHIYPKIWSARHFSPSQDKDTLSSQRLFFFKFPEHFGLTHQVALQLHCLTVDLPNLAHCCKIWKTLNRDRHPHTSKHQIPTCFKLLLIIIIFCLRLNSNGSQALWIWKVQSFYVWYQECIA